ACRAGAAAPAAISAPGRAAIRRAAIRRGAASRSLALRRCAVWADRVRAGLSARAGLSRRSLRLSGRLRRGGGGATAQAWRHDHGCGRAGAGRARHGRRLCLSQLHRLSAQRRAAGHQGRQPPNQDRAGTGRHAEGAGSHDVRRRQREDRAARGDPGRHQRPQWPAR
ncbi:hypothetical protein KXV85_005470, partial [Aspergillus fumigatus]